MEVLPQSKVSQPGALRVQPPGERRGRWPKCLFITSQPSHPITKASGTCTIGAQGKAMLQPIKNGMPMKNRLCGSRHPVLFAKPAPANAIDVLLEKSRQDSMPRPPPGEALTA